MAGLELSERWWGQGVGSDAAELKRVAVLRELSIEIGSDHELAGQIARVEAFFEASDDVIVRLTNGTFALVHPTWSGRRESRRHPTTRQLGTATAATEAVRQWELLW